MSNYMQLTKKLYIVETTIRQLTLTLFSKIVHSEAERNSARTSRESEVAKITRVEILPSA